MSYQGIGAGAMADPSHVAAGSAECPPTRHPRSSTRLAEAEVVRRLDARQPALDHDGTEGLPGSRPRRRRSPPPARAARQRAACRALDPAPDPGALRLHTEPIRPVDSAIDAICHPCFLPESCLTSSGTPIRDPQTGEDPSSSGIRWLTPHSPITTVNRCAPPSSTSGTARASTGTPSSSAAATPPVT